MNSKFIFVLLSIAPLIGYPNKEMQLTEKTEHVQRKSIVRPLYFSSVVQPIRKKNATSPVEGVIVEKLFQFGQNVKKNQPLVVINSTKVETDYQQALTQYLSAKEKFFLAQTKYQNDKTLWNLGIISRDDFENSKSSLNNSNITYLQALNSLETIIKNGPKVSSEITKLNISDVDAVSKALLTKVNFVTVTSPDDGTALMPPDSSSHTGGEKETIDPGSQVKLGQVISVIGDLSGVSFLVEVSEVDIREIRVGQKAQITGVAFPEIQLEGKVVRIDIQASSSSAGGGFPMFTVGIEVEKLTEEQRKILMVGMSAKIRLNVERPGAIEIPIKAVYENSGQNMVKRKRKGVIEEVKIITGQTSVDKVEIKEGLQEGDEIVVPNSA